jgi:hypothetical protein
VRDHERHTKTTGMLGGVPLNAQPPGIRFNRGADPRVVPPRTRAIVTGWRQSQERDLAGERSDYSPAIRDAPKLLRIECPAGDNV